MINFKHWDWKDEEIIYWALMISMAAHLLIVAGFSFSNHIVKPRFKRTEIKYRMVQRSAAAQPPAPAKRNMDMQKVNKTQQKLAAKQVLPNSLLKDINKKKSQIDGVLKDSTKQYSQVIPASGKRSISVPLFESEKISNQRYLSYYSGIRAKILERAGFYENDIELMNNPEFQKGKVYLTFVLSSDGSLKQIQVIGDKTTANAYVQQIGLNIIKEASPFAAFPGNFNYPEISFNMEISFEKK
ncbi:MAG: hypothetical protein A2787_08285 [Omnitrophica WOR_2 bacterium RIFCSPHIGHO2_01_FULL_48_9]|nr:MAG: hypothetical protein A3D10_08035 [Omnitrophica WOR_2 bacterium RIFCSPHIGHO2_02_FULL_48_11]OGX33342.1 MAG: hypothetical protein A2787_08285 [Omnitrophica WOR_2 bacterium RIFCSPHIGHO2_01_FULL_48_9]